MTIFFDHTNINLKNVDAIIDAQLECVDFAILDRKGTYEEGGDETTFSGAENSYYNATAFFLFGSRARGSVQSYVSQLERLNKLIEKKDAEELRNGAESITAARLAEGIRKAEAALMTLAAFMHSDLEVYATVLDEPFGGVNKDGKEPTYDQMLAWFEDKKDSILNPRPTYTPRKDDSAKRKSEAMKRRKASRKAA